MNELSALRRLALSSSRACARLHRMAGGTDAGILAALEDKNALTAAIAAAHRIAARDVARLTDPLVTSDEPATPTLADVEHVRFMNLHG
ncbi:MAG: hypothetical protein JXR75_04295 [Rhodobacteraceae bacterium]|nr:hypothetical protein [Paracoccaceae bacterium]